MGQISLPLLNKVPHGLMWTNYTLDNQKTFIFITFSLIKNFVISYLYYNYPIWYWKKINTNNCNNKITPLLNKNKRYIGSVWIYQISNIYYFKINYLSIEDISNSHTNNWENHNVFYNRKLFANNYKKYNLNVKKYYK